MHKIVVAAWVAVASLVAAVPAAADSPISLPPLAAGEVLVEVTGIGIASTPATSATISVNPTSSGATEAEARRALDTAIAQVTAAARAAGVSAADVEVTARQVSNDPYAVGANGMVMNAYVGDIDVETASSSYYGTAGVTIRLRRAAAAPDLQAAIGNVDNAGAASIEYALDDDSAARREARAEAVRKARADAESHAAAMNMRVARVLRVTERTGTDFMSLMLGGDTNLMRELERRTADRSDGRIQTVAVIGVDYALAPR